MFGEQDIAHLALLKERGTSEIGTTADGLSANANREYGLLLNAASPHIGGTNGKTPGVISCTGDCNVISGNVGVGIVSGNQATNLVIAGNFIGTDSSGQHSLPNGNGGIYLFQGGLIGGTSLEAGNLISGNTNNGVNIDGSGGTIEGNYIGTDYSGANAIPNTGVGVIVLTSSTQGNIGSAVSGTGNLISGNDGAGVEIQGSNESVFNNLFGTGAGGTTPNPNGYQGVKLDSGAHDDFVGGTAPGQANTIAFNGAEGVQATGNSVFSVSIRGNSIHDNLAGIGLFGGANSGIVAPTIVTASPVGASGTGCANCTVDVYSDNASQGRTYEGSIQADGSGAWTFSGAVAGPNATATVTVAGGPYGSTSRFSFPIALGPAPSPTPSQTPTPSPSSPPSSPTPTRTPTTEPSAATTTSATPTPTATPSASQIQGDINCDGRVTLADPTDLLIYIAVNGGAPSGCLSDAAPAAAELFADVNCDGHVNAFDVLDILRHVAGDTEVHLPSGCTQVGHAIS